MAQGRKPTPPDLKVLRGESRPSRLMREAPPSSPDRPQPPSDLCAEELEDFEEIVGRLEALGIASASDVGVITLAARRMYEIRQLAAEISKIGYTYSAGDFIKPNPAVGMQDKAMRHLHSLEASLGLTPVDRGKVQAKPTTKDKPANPFAGLRREHSS